MLKDPISYFVSGRPSHKSTFYRTVVDDPQGSISASHTFSASMLHLIELTGNEHLPRVQQVASKLI